MVALSQMEAKTVLKTGLVFLCAFVLAVAVLKLSPKREMNTGSCRPRALHSAALVLDCKMTEAEVLNLFPRQGFEVSIGEMESTLPKLGLSGKSRMMSVEELRREMLVRWLFDDLKTQWDGVILCLNRD